MATCTDGLGQSADKSERFWDMREAVGELIMVNYIDRLKELLNPMGRSFMPNPTVGCVDSLVYAGRTIFPWLNWTPRSKPKVPGTPAKFNGYWYTQKGLASVANTYGKPFVGAEAFTGARGWRTIHTIKGWAMRPSLKGSAVTSTMYRVIGPMSI